MSLDSILDETLDDLADMPSIAPYPNGAHKVVINWKIDEKKPTSPQLHCVYVEPVEFADPDAKPPAAGDKNAVFFNLKKKDGTANEFAQGAFKIVLAGLRESGVAGNTNREIIENSNGLEVVIVTKIRVGKGEYEGRDSMDITKVVVV